MSPRPTVLALAAAALVLAAAGAHAVPHSYKIDPVHSEVGFKVRHFFTKVPGRFNELSGSFVFDAENPAASRVEATIQARSIFTNNERRDNHLRSGDFLAADSFPTLTFTSTKVEAGDGERLTVHGDLTIRGVTRPVALDAVFLGAAEFVIGGREMGTRAGFEATTKINRKDFGIVWNQVADHGGLMLGDDVEIHIAIEAVRTAPGAVPAAAPRPAGKD